MREDIYIGFTKPKNKNLLSSVIMNITGNQYSGTYLKLSDSLVYLCLFNKLEATDLKTLKINNIVIKEYPIEVTPITKNNILKDTKDFLVNSNNFSHLIKIIFSNIFQAKALPLLHQKFIGQILYKHLGINVNPKTRTATLKDIDESLFFCNYKSIHYIGQ